MQQIDKHKELLDSINKRIERGDSIIGATMSTCFSYYRRYFYRATLDVDYFISKSKRSLWTNMSAKTYKLIDDGGLIKYFYEKMTQKCNTFSYSSNPESNAVFLTLEYAVIDCGAKVMLDTNKSGERGLNIYFKDIESFTKFVNYDPVEKEHQTNGMDAIRYVVDLPPSDVHFDILLSGTKISREPVKFPIIIKSGYRYVDYEAWCNFVYHYEQLLENGCVKKSNSAVLSRNGLKQFEISRKVKKLERIWLPNVTIECRDDATLSHLKLLAPDPELFAKKTVMIYIGDIGEMEANKHMVQNDD